MAIKTKTELLDAFGALIGERNDDEVLAYLEDLTDTLDVIEKDETAEEVERLKGELADMKERYRKRFFTPEEVKEEAEVETAEDADEETEVKKSTFEELFETE